MSTALPVELLQKLPKAELHCHLDGSVRVESIIEMAKEQGVELPTYDVEELRSLVTAPIDCKSLVEYLRGFDITLKVLQRGYAVTRAMFEVAEDASMDGVTYLEVRFSPILHTNEGMSLSQVMDAVCEGVAMAEYRLNIKVRVIVCGMRQMNATVTESLASIAWRYRHKGVVAFDLAGPEHGFSSKLHKSAFKIVRNQLLNCTLHSGEAAGWKSIHDSLRYCGAHRLGHGVALRENAKLQQFCVNRRICIESCVTSNVQTKAVHTLEEHPIKQFYDAGLMVVPCTDNVTVSGCTLSGEYHLIMEQFGMGVEEVVHLIDNGFQSAFCEPVLKNRLRAEALFQIVKVLREASVDTKAIEGHFNTTFDCPGVPFPPLKSFKMPDHPEPTLTLEDVRSIPKVDLHVRLDGSVTLPTMWGEYQRTAPDLSGLGVEPVQGFDQFKQLVQPEVHTHETEERAKALAAMLLQSPDQIKRGLEDIFRVAKSDNVVYFEVNVRPAAHCEGDMNMEDVVRTVVEAKMELSGKFPGITCGVGLCVLAGRDSPITFMEVAKLCVKYRGDGVNSFGVFGSVEINSNDMVYFQETFRFLKSESFNVTMSCGRKDPSSITVALHEGGAGRITGGYMAHHNPNTMQYLAIHGIPLEVNVGGKLKKLTRDISGFQHYVRLMMDMDVPVTICSFRRALYGQGRCEGLLSLSNAAGLSLAELLKVMGNSYKHAYLDHAERERMYREFYTTSSEYLKGRGFDVLSEKTYFPH